jgi:hypothetical protein
VWHIPRLTRGHIWILALAAHQPEIKWLRALLLHLDHNKLSPAASGLYADNVAITHGCGGASCGLFSDRSGRPRMVRWCRGVPGSVENKPLANVSQSPVLVKMIPAPGFDDTAEEQRGQGPYVSCGRAISKRRLTSVKRRMGNFMFPSCRLYLQAETQKRVEQAAPGQAHDPALGLLRHPEHAKRRPLQSHRVASSLGKRLAVCNK